MSLIHSLMILVLPSALFPPHFQIKGEMMGARNVRDGETTPRLSVWLCGERGSSREPPTTSNEQGKKKIKKAGVAGQEVPAGRIFHLIAE